MATSSVVVSNAPRRQNPPIDREKVCPLLLRVFTKLDSHHRPEEFQEAGREPEDEVQIYTWRDATLRELSDLIKEVNPMARRRDARLSFSLIYPNTRGRYVSKHLGITQPYRRGEDDKKTLDDVHFVTGDYLDVAILLGPALGLGR
ncbi:Histone deacetylase complex subunit SAP18 [Balamuthia mandrillaris]